MMVLKRVEDAERDGDRIYAVLKGVAGSSDGKGRSMTAPRLEGQILALQRAYARAGIRPSTVGLIEAHGTGTTLGDASELAAVADVFQADGAAPLSCAIGSVKSMVGHTKSAAGITGLDEGGPVALSPGAAAHPARRKTQSQAARAGHAAIHQHRGAALDPADRNIPPRRRQRVRIWRHQLPRRARGICGRPERPRRYSANRRMACRAFRLGQCHARRSGRIIRGAKAPSANSRASRAAARHPAVRAWPSSRLPSTTCAPN